MAIADVIYSDVIRQIHECGEWDTDAPVRTRWKDGTPAHTKSVLNAQMIFHNDLSIPMLTQKRVPTKDPIQEMFWIWKYKSNDVRFLRDELGCKVWNEWEREDGTIGKSYGWQLKNKHREVYMDKTIVKMMNNGEIKPYSYRDGLYVMLDQVDYLLYMLKANPYSRRIKTTLWCTEDLDDMSLEPCVYETHWQMWGGKLHLTVNIRSNDMGLGNPYNIYQYAILHRLVGHVTQRKIGTICFNIDNAHIYDRHMDILLEQIEAPMHDAPQILINEDVKSFYDFTIDDIHIVDYKCEKTRKMEIAI